MVVEVTDSARSFYCAVVMLADDVLLQAGSRTHLQDLVYIAATWQEKREAQCSIAKNAAACNRKEGHIGPPKQTNISVNRPRDQNGYDRESRRPETDQIRGHSRCLGTITERNSGEKWVIDGATTILDGYNL